MTDYVERRRAYVSQVRSSFETGADAGEPFDREENVPVSPKAPSPRGLASRSDDWGSYAVSNAFLVSR